jgi:hypothetical protein
MDPNGDYFFGWFGSTSEQRKSARAFAKETGGSVKNITSKNVKVSFVFGTTMANTGIASTGFYSDGFAKIFGRAAHTDFQIQGANKRGGGKLDPLTGRYGAAPPASGRVEMVDDPFTGLGPGLIRGLVGKLTLAATEKVLEKAALNVVEDVVEEKLPLLLAQAINVTNKGLLHTLERHTINGVKKWMGKSKFLVSSEDAVRELIQRATQIPGVKQANGNIQRIVNAGKDIGIDMATKSKTSIYTVITDASNNLVTAFPGVPGR